MNENFDKLKQLILSDIDADELEYLLSDYHDSDIADVLESLDEDQRIAVYRKLGTEKISDIFTYYDNVEDFIEEVTPEVAADILEEMDADEALEVLNELEEEDKKEILELMEEEDKQEILKIDAYNEEEIGSYMTDNFIVISKDSTISTATKQMIAEAGEHDNIFTIYVIDENNKYCGAIDIKDLICARKTVSLESIVMSSYPFFNDRELMSECINRLKDYSEESVPILNEKMEIVGVITKDILIDAAMEEVEEDYAKLGGLAEAEDIDESVFTSVKKRIPWLLILLVLGLVVATAVGRFEGVIAALPVVVFFQSMILDMAGNVGTQSLAVTIRNLSDEESKKKLRQNIFKEIRVGLLNGIIIATVAFIFVVAYIAITQAGIKQGISYNFNDSLLMATAVSVSLLCAMTISNVVGTLFPIILNKMKIDPAVASGPFITTVNDIVAVVIYYGLNYLLFMVIFK